MPQNVDARNKSTAVRFNSGRPGEWLEYERFPADRAGRSSDFGTPASPVAVLGLARVSPTVMPGLVPGIHVLRHDGTCGGWVYIVTNRPTRTLYVGVTADIVRRAWEHRDGAVDGFTRRSCPRLLWCLPFGYRFWRAAVSLRKPVPNPRT